MKAVCSYFFSVRILFLFLFLSGGQLAAQEIPDTNEINANLAKVWPMHFRNLDSALMLSNYSYQQATQTPNRYILMRSMHMVGVIEQEAGNYKRSILFLDSAIFLAKRLNDMKRLGHLYNSIGMSHYLDGNYRVGMEYVLNSAKLKEQNGDFQGTITTYINISALYAEQGDPQNAMKYAKDASAMCTKQKVTAFLPEALDALGRANLVNNDTVNAISHFEAAIAEAQKTNTPLKAIRSLESLSALFLDLKDTASARKYILLYEEYTTATNDKSHLSGLYASYARYYLLKKEYRNAEKYSRICIGLAEGNTKPGPLADMYFTYVQSLKAQGKTNEAIVAFERLTKLKDSLNAETSATAAKRLSAEFENQKQENQISSLNAEKAKNEAEIRQKNTYILIAGIGLVLILISLVVIIRVYRKSKRNVALLELKNKEIGIKNEIITTRNQDISDSITYARRIQDALMLDAQTVKAAFPESFILYKPKDVLSGDFFWFTEKDGKKIIAAVDCTGHGIPGALLSIACSSFLNEIVNQKAITAPAEILSELRFMVIRSLKQTGAQGETKDGLDISLVVIDEKKHKLSFAGANNCLCIVRNQNGKMLIEKIDGDRRTVGYHLGKGLPFTPHDVAYSTGDCVYLFTDGYSDQFGGEDNKKYRRKTMMEFLEMHSHLPMAEQEKLLLEEHLKWKADAVQTDDILVIGFRI